MEAERPETCFLSSPRSQHSGKGPGFCLLEAGVSDANKLGQCPVPSGGNEHHLECRGIQASSGGNRKLVPHWEAEAAMSLWDSSMR